MVFITCSVEHDAERIYIDGSYAVTFGAHSTDVWTLSPDGRTLSHQARLAQTLKDPGVVKPIIDAALGLVAIVHRNSDDVHDVCVFALQDGRLERTLWLYNAPYPGRMPYVAGRAIVASTDAEGGPVLLVLDLAGNGWIVGNAYPGAEIALHFSSNGDIVAASPSTDRLELLLFSGDATGTVPTKRAEFPVLMYDGDTVLVQCSAPLGTDAFIVSAGETLSEAIFVAKSCHSVIRALESADLSVRWEAAPLWGELTRVLALPARGLVVAAGIDCAADRSWRVFVAVLDARTGALRRWDDVADDGLRACRLGADAVVLACADGGVCVTQLDDFLERGFPRTDNGALAVVRPWAERAVSVHDVAVSGSSAVVLTEGEITVLSW